MRLRQEAVRAAEASLTDRASSAELACREAEKRRRAAEAAVAAAEEQAHKAEGEVRSVLPAGRGGQRRRSGGRAGTFGAFLSCARKGQSWTAYCAACVAYLPYVIAPRIHHHLPILLLLGGSGDALGDTK